MSELLWIRSHVERLLQDEWEEDRVTIDVDGDVVWRRGTARGWVSVIPAGDTHLVRVWAHAAHGVKPSAKLLRELNDIQLRCTSSTVMVSGSIVVVSQTISAVGLTGPVIAQALEAVGNVADDIGTMVAIMFGGETPFPVVTSASEDAA